MDERFYFRNRVRLDRATNTPFFCLFPFLFKHGFIFQSGEEIRWTAVWVLFYGLLFGTGVYNLLAWINEGVFLRNNCLEVLDYLGRVSGRIPYRSIESFHMVGYTVRPLAFALVAKGTEIRIPGDTRSLAKLSLEIKRRHDAEEPSGYPRWGPPVSREFHPTPRIQVLTKPIFGVVVAVAVAVAFTAYVSTYLKPSITLVTVICFIPVVLVQGWKARRSINDAGPYEEVEEW